MAATAGEAGLIRSSRARLPTQGRGEVLLLLGPCALYLAAFSIFPLVTSLVRSFEEYDTRADSWHWVGLDNYSQLIHSSDFWTVVENTVLLTAVGVATQVVLGTALALFFNQRLRGSALVRGILILPMLLTPIVVGLMWRALLNPEWGLLNWVAVKLGLGYVGWLSDPHVALWTLVVVDSWQWTPFVFVIVYARLQALPQEVFEAGSVDGASWFQRTLYLTLPLLWPAIVFAAVFRAIDAFRTFDLVFGLTNGGPVQSTTTLSFEAFQNGFEFQHYGYASAISYVMVIAAAIGITLLFRVVKVRRLEVAT
ncbi:MAG TPA: sugar ABC transporter permease [Gaiellaceae bacterium]|nr:sugar ABC transporter permease [Gaiellaceae bacterium]